MSGQRQGKTTPIPVYYASGSISGCGDCGIFFGFWVPWVLGVDFQRAPSYHMHGHVYWGEGDRDLPPTTERECTCAKSAAS